VVVAVHRGVLGPVANPREDVAAQVRSAWRVVGAYARGDGAMVGFARAVSDGVALAYLADVFVLPAHRGQGLGRALVATMIDAGRGAEFRWLFAHRRR
jgi:GNAT superfamily N-acetyltransferase